MKYCIDCGRNNGKNKLLFEGAQCVDCYNHNPIVLVQVPVVSIKIVPVKEKKEIVRCECGRPIKDIRKRGRPLGGSSISERVFNLPDKKVCVGCEEEKLITDYYTRNGLPYAQCKKCHKKRCKEWESNNKEKISVYYKEYQKNYVRKSKRMLKINLPPNGI